MTATAEEAPDPITVLHVDDDPELLDLTAAVLDRSDGRFEVVTTTRADDAAELLEETDVDCVVSDFQMPGADGLEFLADVRRTDPDLPFILFTGKGSEEIASEAISAGVTDYLQKGADASQYDVLENRIENAVRQYRLEREYERIQRRFEKLIEHSAEVIPILDADGVVKYVTPSVTPVLGYDPEEVVGDNAFEYIHPEDRERAMERFMESLEDEEAFPDVEYRFKHADGSWVTLYGRAINLLDDPDVEGIVSYNRDVSDLVED